MFKFCPSCASKKISFKDGKLFNCPDCGFHLYHNTAAATACLISVPSGCGQHGEQRILFMVRAREPGKGMLDLPGGFVDPGEGVFECVHRELKEEIGWIPPSPPKLFASFPNVYPYKNIDYNTCDLFFSVTAPGLSEQDLRLEQSEIAGVRFLKPEEIDYSEIAFESIRRGVQAYLTI
jgi:ADP-ribose pyrophosphatase YjhB (NUDIX family)